ncbi:MAG: hypothetical protein NTZ65_03145 [Candidatus Berkelbacteria bacterium]|nr:hypothetical protein [Candidatus Berkelbacteria bacterium]
MPERTSLGVGKCPRCGGETERTHVAIFPFEDDEQSCTEEKCKCGFYMETAHSSSNAMTTHSWACGDDFRERALAPVKECLSDLINRKVQYGGDVQAHEILAALGDLPKSRFPYVYVFLAQKSAQIEVDHASFMENQIDLARSHPEVGSFTDDEAASSARGTAAFVSAITQVRDLLRGIEDGPPRFKLKVMTSFVDDDERHCNVPTTLFFQDDNEAGAYSQAFVWIQQNRADIKAGAGEQVWISSVFTVVG